MNIIKKCSLFFALAFISISLVARAAPVDDKITTTKNVVDSKLEFFFLGTYLPTPTSPPRKRLRSLSVDWKNNRIIETVIEQTGARETVYNRTKDNNNVYRSDETAELVQELLFYNMDTTSSPSSNLRWTYSVYRLGKKLKSIESKLNSGTLIEQHLSDSLAKGGAFIPPTLMTLIGKAAFEEEKISLASTNRPEYSGKVLLDFAGQNKQPIEQDAIANFRDDPNGLSFGFNIKIAGYINENLFFTRSVNNNKTYFISPGTSLGAAFWRYDLFVESGISVLLPKNAANGREFLVKLKLAKGARYSGKISFLKDKISANLVQDSDNGLPELPKKISFNFPKTGILLNKKNAVTFDEDLGISSGSTSKYFIGIDRPSNNSASGDIQSVKYILYRRVSSQNMERITNIFHDRDSGRVIEDFVKQKESTFFAIRPTTGYRWLLTPGSSNDWKIIGKNESTILKRDVTLQGERYIENKTKLSSSNQVLDSRTVVLTEITEQEYFDSLNGYSRNGTPRYFVGTSESESKKTAPCIASFQQAPGYGLIRIYIALENELFAFLLTQKSDASSWSLEGPRDNAKGEALIINAPKSNAPGEIIIDSAPNFDLRSLHFSFASKNKDTQFKGQFKLDKNDLYIEISTSKANKSAPIVYKMTLKDEKQSKPELAFLPLQKSFFEKLIAPAAKQVEKTKPLDPEKPNAKK
jgi:hypothetical protein